MFGPSPTPTPTHTLTPPPWMQQLETLPHHPHTHPTIHTRRHTLTHSPPPLSHGCSNWSHYLKTVFKLRFKLPRLADGLYEVSKRWGLCLYVCTRGSGSGAATAERGWHPSIHFFILHILLSLPYLQKQPVKVAQIGDYDVRYLSLSTADGVLPQPVIQAIDGAFFGSIS